MCSLSIVDLHPASLLLHPAKILLPLQWDAAKLQSPSRGLPCRYLLDLFERCAALSGERIYIRNHRVQLFFIALTTCAFFRINSNNSSNRFSYKSDSIAQTDFTALRFI